MGVAVQRYAYDSFGNIKFTPFPIWIKQPYTYTGREFDHETGLYYYRARYYDPKAGRFITKDPIGFEGGDYNLYVYVKNNSINYTDPEGLKTYMCKKFLHALGGKGQRTGPDMRGNPLYHQYICVIKSDGIPICGGQDRSDNAWSRGTPSQDYYSPNNCTQIDPDNECLEQCIINAIKSPKRPYYGLFGPGTNCQEWADDTYKACKSQWR
jgi:RHS repeat-associated protein